VQLHNTEGNAVDISGSSNRLNMDLMSNIGATRSFGTIFPVRLVCGKDATITLRAIYSEGNSEAMEILKDWYENHYADSRELTVSLPDGTAGSDRYRFQVLLERLPIPADVEDPAAILVEVTLLPTGEFHISSVAS